ncbi:MAG: cupredoxin family copper-binding protein [Actinomycetota bacterium]|nr:cupredoxin family copper-binding protein [Actinomycetota bacterium]
MIHLGGWSAYLGMRIKSLALPGLAVIVVGAGGLALGHSRREPSGGSAVVVRGQSAHLEIASYAFTPAALTVKSGTQITVTNHDQTAHTATANSGSFDSGTLKPGQAARFTVTKPGTYTYICQFHAFMTGTIKVVK